VNSKGQEQEDTESLLTMPAVQGFGTLCFSLRYAVTLYKYNVTVLTLQITLHFYFVTLFGYFSVTLRYVTNFFLAHK
jgi:hypothetical protein